MKSEESNIDLNELLRLSIDLAIKSCFLLHSCSDHPEICMKGVGNPVTQVDFLIQKLIASKIDEKFQKIRVLGEEDFNSKEFEALQHFDCQKIKSISSKEYNFQVPNEAKFEKLYQKDEICIWLDPLDCTNGFINNRKHQVTILIGIVYKGQPICGVIGHPYKENTEFIDGRSYFEPTVMIGSSQFKLQSAFELNITKNEWKTYEKQNILAEGDEGKLMKKVAVGYRKPNQLQNKVIKQMGLKVTKAGGAGFKALKLIKRQVDTVLFIGMKTSKWDTCAAEAIISAMGGYSIKPNLKPIEYGNFAETQNKDGVIFSLNGEIFTKIIDIIKTF